MYIVLIIIFLFIFISRKREGFIYSETLQKGLQKRLQDYNHRMSIIDKMNEQKKKRLIEIRKILDNNELDPRIKINLEIERENQSQMLYDFRPDRFFLID